MNAPRKKRTRAELDAAMYRRRINRGIVLPVGEIINGVSYVRKDTVISVMAYYGITVTR